MKDEVAVFGEKGSLIGVVSLPDKNREIINGPGIILLNSGLLHRVGPNRLYVKIARNAATSGLVAFRFDLSGIGDKVLLEIQDWLWIIFLINSGFEPSF